MVKVSISESYSKENFAKEFETSRPTHRKMAVLNFFAKSDVFHCLEDENEENLA